MREQYFPSREALKARVEALVERVAGASSPEGLGAATSLAEPVPDPLHATGLIGRGTAAAGLGLVTCSLTLPSAPRRSR